MTERVPGSLSYTRCTLIGRQNRPFQNRPDVQKFAVHLGCPTLLLFLHCACYFFLELLAGYTVLGCYEVTMLT